MRIYYWRSGPTEFTFACGEVKKENMADPLLIRLARNIYRKTREMRRARKQQG